MALVAVRSPTPYLSRVRSGWAKCRIVEDGNVDQGGFRRASLRALYVFAPCLVCGARTDEADPPTDR